MTGIGSNKAALIWYRALTMYLTSTSNFADARAQTIRAARDLYGNGNETIALGVAWGLCGVGEITTPDPRSLIQNGGFEIVAAPWSFSSTTSGSVSYISRGAFKHSGNGYAQAGGINNAGGLFLTGFSIPSTAISANISFWYQITTLSNSLLPEDTLTVTLNNDATGIMLWELIILSNLDASSSYVQSPFYDLMDYQGTPLRVDFYVSTDSNFPTTFRVDDVLIQSTWY